MMHARKSLRRLVWALVLPLCAGLQAGKSNAADAAAAVISASADTALSLEDYRAYLVGPRRAELAQMTADRDQLRELVLDFHSDVVLAREAEALGLADEPRIAARLAQARRQLLIQALVERVAEELDMPDLEPLARERYALQRNRLRAPERRRAAHILLADPQHCPCDESAPAAERARALREELLAGADFAAAAREHSLDPGTAGNGGELSGWIRRDGRTVKPFEDAVFALAEPGDISQPVESRFGVHLVKLLEVEPGRQRTFDEVRDELVRQLQNERITSAVQQRRSAAYPDLDSVDFDVLEALVEELLQR